MRMFYFWYLEEIFYSQMIGYFVSCKKLCQDSGGGANIIGTFIYFNHQLCRLLQCIVPSLDVTSSSSNVAD